jgi:anti-sigma B factor antagonist/stage II sporulation protein AA (anti-sigma F factor antagonist)
MKENIMEDISQEIRGDVLTNRVNLLRATINEATVLKDLLEEQVVFGHSELVVDLSQCTHLDSTFIGVLVVTQKKLLAKGGELKIVEPLDPARELFHLTGISKVFETFETSDEAVKSFYDQIKPPESKSDGVTPNKNVAWAFAQ